MPLVKHMGLFGRAARLERQMDEFLDRVSEAGILFKMGLEAYLQSGCGPEFDRIVAKIDEIETRGDQLRRGIETELFEQTLIPDLRADVLSLIEDVDLLLNLYEEGIYRFLEEIPDIPEEYHADFKHLTGVVVACVECCIQATRAFFRDINAVRDHVHKVLFHESEADDISSEVIQRIFRSELDLVRKKHLREFLDAIDAIADQAEDLSDYLSIYTIKRSI